MVVIRRRHKATQGESESKYVEDIETGNNDLLKDAYQRRGEK